MTGVAVVGGGIVGLSIAWRLRQRGVAVTVYDPVPGRGASDVAAGMLAPVGEAAFGETDLVPLLCESARRWPAFAAALESESGLDVGYRTGGALLVARTGDEAAELERLLRLQSGLGLAPQRLTVSELREREPALAPRLRGGAFVPGDHHVDPRRLVAALLATGIPVRPVPVDDLSTVDGDTVVVAAGCASAALTGLPVRPVKGEVLRLRGAVLMSHVIRGHRVYLVPRADGEVVVGATTSERTDPAVSAGSVLDLLRAAVELVPGLAEHEFVEARYGFRPGTPDNAPIVGELRPGVLVATGHYRNGVLLAPVTADAVADLVTGGPDARLLEPFHPRRFTEVTR